MNTQTSFGRIFPFNEFQADSNVQSVDRVGNQQGILSHKALSLLYLKQIAGGLSRATGMQCSVSDFYYVAPDLGIPSITIGPSMQQDEIRQIAEFQLFAQGFKADDAYKLFPQLGEILESVNSRSTSLDTIFRSAHHLEGGSLTSAAGIFKSYVNLGNKSLRENLLKVIFSPYSRESLFFHHHRGIDVVPADMIVHQFDHGYAVNLTLVDGVVTEGTINKNGKSTFFYIENGQSNFPQEYPPDLKNKFEGIFTNLKHAFELMAPTGTHSFEFVVDQSFQNIIPKQMRHLSIAEPYATNNGISYETAYTHPMILTNKHGRSEIDAIVRLKERSYHTGLSDTVHFLHRFVTDLRAKNPNPRIFLILNNLNQLSSETNKLEEFFSCLSSLPITVFADTSVHTVGSGRFQMTAHASALALEKFTLMLMQRGAFRDLSKSFSGDMVQNVINHRKTDEFERLILRNPNLQVFPDSFETYVFNKPHRIETHKSGIRILKPYM